ncbi:formate dehydrogenase subunit gamma [Sulfurospirillum sp. T05]|uniref:Formate dehydrogenase subunit gamma n=1 Tax=Sulfurospirillum tamanense TaxID=2813362 RepID=A0ABS2WNY9_9BACT|nr:formate dehydrogenase subunit gamma [Sulfurospirillum tamanensis]MBN2963340.1 formate dehydrogenase subunit gamma [Sulfurospirillum tamanensis]
MKNSLRTLLLLPLMVSAVFAAENPIWGEGRITNIFGYGKEGSTGLGPLFTLLQNQYFVPIFLAIIVGVPAVFLLHYLVIGPKVFPHGGKKIKVFSLFNRVIHQIAAISFIVIIPTGIVMVFGSFFGGGWFVTLCKDLHGLFTIPFALVVIPMFFMWVKEAIPNTDDIKWMMILGGYLSKEKKPIPAGKFNAGQKMWFWIATLGSLVMVITGVMMYLLDFDMSMLVSLTGLSQIDLLRLAAILHNVVGFAVLALFITHVYMSMFAIKGAVHSIIDGHMEEEEVRILHSSYYKKLQKEGKI